MPNDGAGAAARGAPAPAGAPAPSGTMSGPPRARFIDHRGQRIILLDFSGLTDFAVGLVEIEKAREFIATQKPDGSHFTLTDVTATRYDRQIVDAFKAFTVHNRPYVKAAAVVTDSRLHRAAIGMVAMFSKRRLEVAPTREAALEWLATQR